MRSVGVEGICNWGHSILPKYNFKVLGKGHSSVVTAAYMNGEILAVKSRRVDGRRSSLYYEGETLWTAWEAGASPRPLYWDDDIIVMEAVMGPRLLDVVEGKSLIPLERAIIEAIRAARILDSIGVVHSELHRPWKNVIYNNIFVGFWSFQSFVIVGAVVAVLVAMLRSVTIPLRLVATVLMSVVWALALTVLVFQGVLGKPTYWLLPIILFSLLISVGTDYDIFLVARIREEVQRGADIGEAVESAVRTTGPIITGAAAVLASAFATLGLSKILILQEVGVAVVAAVLIDAFVMRTFLVPAVLVLLRKWNWWPWNA